MSLVKQYRSSQRGGTERGIAFLSYGGRSHHEGLTQIGSNTGQSTSTWSVTATPRQAIPARRLGTGFGHPTRLGPRFRGDERIVLPDRIPGAEARRRNKPMAGSSV